MGLARHGPYVRPKQCTSTTEIWDEVYEFFLYSYFNYGRTNFNESVMNQTSLSDASFESSETFTLPSLGHVEKSTSIVPRCGSR